MTISASSAVAAIYLFYLQVPTLHCPFLLLHLWPILSPLLQLKLSAWYRGRFQILCNHEMSLALCITPNISIYHHYRQERGISHCTVCLFCLWNPLYSQSERALRQTYFCIRRSSWAWVLNGGITSPNVNKLNASTQDSFRCVMGHLMDF